MYFNLFLFLSRKGPFQGSTSFVDHSCYFCLVFVMISCASFNDALWSPARNGLTSWLLLVRFIVFLLLSHVVSLFRCGTSLYRLLIFAVFLTLYIFSSIFLSRKGPFQGGILFVDHSIIHVISVLCLLCFCVCSLLPCGHLLGKGWPLGSCL